MSAFKALNIEYDEVSDVEVDDTKEIQIEEALKLYQTALRYHAEGPASFKAAAEAYKELFASEIFKYPESQNELQRIELYGPIDQDDLWQERIGDNIIVPTTLDAGPSTLPQILHLSHKNYAQFRLEELTARFDKLQASITHVLSDASQALEHFVAALDKDDSDLDLWKKTARVGELLDSKRITRFCLEAVLDGDEEGLGSVLSLPGIEDGIAAQQLKTLVTNLNDNLSLMQPSLTTQHRKVLSRLLKQRLDSGDDLVQKLQQLRTVDSEDHHKALLSRQQLRCPQSWSELGNSLLQRKTDESGSRKLVDPAVYFELPDQGDEQTQIFEDAVEEMDIETAQPATAEIDPAEDQANAAIKPVPQQSTRNRTESPLETRRPSTATNGDNDTQTLTLPSRKRPGDDATEEGRARPKRLRARDSIADPADNKQALHDANVQWEYDQHLKEIQGADDWLYETVGAILNKIGITSFEGIRDVKAELAQLSSAAQRSSNYHLAQSELSQFLNDYSDLAARAFLASSDSLVLHSGSITSEADTSTGTARPDQHKRRDHPHLTNQHLDDFLQYANDTAQPLDPLAVDFIEMMTWPDRFKSHDSKEASYTTHLWPEQLKSSIMRTLVQFDDAIYARALASLQSHRSRQPDETLGHDSEDVEAFLNLRVHLQNVFELHLDIYRLIKQSNSGVDRKTIAVQGDRLDRWFEVTREANYALAQHTHGKGLTSLEARFLWSTTFYLAALDDASQEHILGLMQDLHSRLSASNTIVELINNAVISEISVAALDREMSKLTTREFFERISDMETSDPVALIETIEPLLDVLDARSQGSNDAAMSDTGSGVSSELITFLENKRFSEIFQLWTRLLDAYTQIDYTPMIVRTRLRMVRLVLGQLKDTQIELISVADRSSLLLSIIKVIDKLTIAVLDHVVADKESLDCLDDQDLQLSITAFGEILRLLQAFNVFEDPIRIGKSQPPSSQSGSKSSSFEALCKALHDMQLRIWIVLYFLLKESMAQNSELFSTPLEDRFDFLRTLHRNLGIRAICGGLDKIFIKMCKDEFFTMTHVDGYDSEQAQVLYDLYGLNCFVNPSYELMDHHCEHYAFLDRTVANQALDLLLSQADRLPIKELVKHPLKDAIDKVHGGVTRKRPTEPILRNREIIRALLKSPIHPLNLFQALKGSGNQLAMSRVPESDASLAAKGWYFLMGHISLTKFRTTKRNGSTPTEDVDIAIAFFMQELEYSTTRWETWFRLAQAYDTKVEECVVWSAEKLNGSMPEVANLQKAAVHCYTMATALAYRSADLAFETSDKMTELYSEFAMRMYSSTRQPFGMLPFAKDESDKFLSRNTGVSKGSSFQPLRMYTAWKIAKVLFQRAIAGSSKQWMLHYMLGKCLWKMYSASEEIRGQDHRPTMQDVLGTFFQAIGLLPGKKESRESKREPTLEPHYKLVSIVHKLVTRGEMTFSQAKEALQHTHFIKSVEFPSGPEGWLDYIMAVLRNLRAADKSNWHHRMIARSAQIVFDDSREPDELVRAAKTKHELTQQMFTKTMVLQVWRPEAERAGRHFVYTARYTRFFVQILELLKDTTSLEQLARRVRRRPHEIFEHSLVWQDIIYAYLRLLRERGSIQEGLETSTFSNITHEEFLVRKDPLEQWMQNQDEGSNVVLDVLREVQELKKINANLMKLGPIDDLIGDAYAYLYSTTGKELWDNHQRLEQEKPKSPARTPAIEISNPMHIASILSLDGVSGSSMTKAEPTPEPESAPTKRRPGIGRREIRSAAEACVHKPVAAKHVDKPRSSMLIKTEQPVDETNIDTSAPGSVVDDADDESDLSDVEDGATDGSVAAEQDNLVKPLFPGLTTSKNDNSDAGAADDESNSNPAEGENADTTMAELALEHTIEENDAHAA